MGIKLHIKGARLSFANGLFTASSVEENQTKKFGCDMILVPGCTILREMPDGKRVPAKMDDVMLDVANETWKGKGKVMLDALEASKKCYRNGDLKLDKGGNVRDGYEGCWYITAKNEKRPGTFNKDGSPVNAEDGVLYSGCYAYFIVELYGNAQAAKKGVFASLLGVRFERDGDSFGGGRSAASDEFDPAEEGAGADDFA